MSSTSNKSKYPRVEALPLMELMRDRPCIWDKSHEAYSDKGERKNAWIEIYERLFEDYDSFPAEEKRLLAEQVQGKWTNLRDTFIKSLKPKGRKNRRYIYYDNLSFLLKNVDKSQLQDLQDLGEIEQEIGEQDMRYFDFDSEPPSVPKEKVKVKKESKKRKSSTKVSDERTDIEFVNECQTVYEDSKLFPDSDDPRVMNEDEAFFASLLPTVVTYTTEERLEFRMEVLSIMKRINDKKMNYL